MTSRTFVLPVPPKGPPPGFKQSNQASIPGFNSSLFREIGILGIRFMLLLFYTSLCIILKV